MIRPSSDVSLSPIFWRCLRGGLTLRDTGFRMRMRMMAILMFFSSMSFFLTCSWGSNSALGPSESSVVSPRVVYSINTQHPALALTFDDGPHPEYTPAILDILSQYGVRATFFVVGANVKKYPDIVQRIVSDGHQIANHSFTHAAFTKLKAKKLDKEVKDTNLFIESYSGVNPTCIRPPYGDVNERVLNSLLHGHKMNVIMWSVDPQDWKKPGVEAIVKRVVSGVKPGSIVLLHDIHAQTLAALPTVLAALKSQGYLFGTIDQLLSLEPPQLRNSDTVDGRGDVSNPLDNSYGVNRSGETLVNQSSLGYSPSSLTSSGNDGGVAVEKPLLAPPPVVHGLQVPVRRAVPVSAVGAE